MEHQDEQNTPVTPLPNPGEGGPVHSVDTIPAVPITPATPVPDHSVPAAPDDSIPAAPAFPAAPAPGGSIPAAPTFPATPAFPTPSPIPRPQPSGIILPIWPRFAKVRFLNAAYGYRPFRILVNNTRVSNPLDYGALTPYGKVPAGYQTITVTAPDGYVYIQKSLPFQVNQPMTVAIINTINGLDLLQITDNCCTPNGDFSNFRVSNLSLNSPPLDVLLGDGRVVYGDVRYKETTPYKRIRPGSYQFFFAETSLAPMPLWMDIETLDSAFTGTYPVPNTLTSLYLNAVSNINYTVFLIPSGPQTIQPLLVESR